MRVWLYYRLSRDEDTELNSLTNQRNILVEYADANGHQIVGESFDDNVSGMHFNREGISKIYEQVELKAIDAVIVKDLSRLGRHRTQTAMFIDYLRENEVRVLSVTENTTFPLFPSIQYISSYKVPLLCFKAAFAES